MGCVYRRGKVYWIKYYRNGRPFIESSKSEELEIAKKLLKIREGDISQGKIPSLIFERVVFDELVKDFLTDYKINGRKSYDRAERSTRYLLQDFGGMKAFEVNTPLINRYIEKRLAEGLANGTINIDMAVLKRIFNIAKRCTPPKVQFVPYIPKLKTNNVRKGFIEFEEYRALYEALPVYLKPILTFAYFTGWRKSEILDLQWNQVDLVDGTVRLDPGETKNDEGRTICMEPLLLETIKSLHHNRLRNCPYVFHFKGRRIVDFRESWDKACIAIKKPDLLFHDLRRSAIRNMIRAGVPERVAMMISGHKTRSIFDRYNIVSQDDLKEAALRIQAFSERQAEQLQFSYNLPKKAKTVTNLKLVTL